MCHSYDPPAAPTNWTFICAHAPAVNPPRPMLRSLDTPRQDLHGATISQSCTGLRWNDWCVTCTQGLIFACQAAFTVMQRCNSPVWSTRSSAYRVSLTSAVEFSYGTLMRDLCSDVTCDHRVSLHEANATLSSPDGGA